MSESVHRESLNTSIPTPLWLPVFLSLPHSFLFNNTTTLRPTISLCLEILTVSPNCLHFLDGLISGFLTVKQPHNRSGALSLIMASVYCRFHAPPHQQPIFPHMRACMCIFKHTEHTYIHMLITHLNDVCAHAFIRACSYSHAGLIVGASRRVAQILITCADYE